MFCKVTLSHSSSRTLLQELFSSYTHAYKTMQFGPRISFGKRLFMPTLRTKSSSYMLRRCERRRLKKNFMPGRYIFIANLNGLKHFKHDICSTYLFGYFHFIFILYVYGGFLFRLADFQGVLRLILTN